MSFVRFLSHSAGLLSVAVLSACQAAPGPKPETSPHAGMDEIIEIREPGLIANYYPAATAAMPGPALLMVGGSEGGLNEGVAVEAEALRDEGISVLHLSFYRFEGQEQNLEMVPLERFDTGLDWLRARDEVDADRVGIYGTSKGAEAALITATRHPEIEAVVAIVPSSVSWTGINWDFDGRESQASWSLDGGSYPALPYGAFDYEAGLYSLYDNGLDAVNAHPETVIEVERIEGRVLLVCGGSDALWPSCPMAESIEARAESLDGPEVTLLAYPEAGHGAGGKPADILDPETADAALDWGGTPASNRAAQQDNWPKTVAFLKDAL